MELRELFRRQSEGCRTLCHFLMQCRQAGGCRSFSLLIEAQRTWKMVENKKIKEEPK